MIKTIENTFPNFVAFSTDDFSDYQKYMYRFPQHCDFTLNNMIIWLNGNTSMHYSWLNDNLILRIEEVLYDGWSTGEWHTILGDKLADDTLEKIFEKGAIKKLLFVPDYFVKTIKHSNNYILTNDMNNRDYILDVESLIKKSGKTYENFRYQISYFLKHYSEDAVIREIDLKDPKIINELANGLHIWLRINALDNSGNDPGRKDAQAVDRLLRVQSILPVKHRCLGLYIEGKLQAFSIFHVPISKDKIAMGNHIKFNSDYNRLFDFLVYATAIRLRQQGIKLLNAEQDMGIEGLKKHKSYLNPIMYYEKYSILPK